ncbi:UNVERIFIED_CONTAM: hypothetical protein NY100_04115 [Prevotella sp. 15_C9]
MIERIKDLFRREIPLSGLSPAVNKQLVSKGLKELGCDNDWEKEGDNDVMYFTYQGEHFVITAKMGISNIQLSICGMAAAPMPELNNVRQLCNRYNLKSNGLHFTYRLNDRINEVGVDLHYNFLLFAGAESVILARSLYELFQGRNHFLVELNVLLNRSKEYKGKDMELITSQITREFFLLREHEAMHEKPMEKWQPKETKVLTLKQWMDKAYGCFDFVPTHLSIFTDKMNAMTERAEIENFEIASLLIANQAFTRKTATMTLSFINPLESEQNRHMTIFVEQAESTQDTLCYRVTSTLMPSPLESNFNETSNFLRPMTVTAVMGFDLRTEKQRTDEFNYMWQDAKDKTKKEDTDSLNEEQKLINEIASPLAAKYAYRGKQLYLQGKFFEAILHLENAFSLLKEERHELTARQRESFFDICYMLGFCHDELKQYQRAFYYLSLTIFQNGIVHTEEYINCMINLRDFRALPFIDNVIRDVSKNYENANDNEPPEEHIQAFLSFLHRRKAYILIEQERHDEAESLLNTMLHDPYGYDFALKELAYLQQIRAKKK